MPRLHRRSLLALALCLLAIPAGAGARGASVSLGEVKVSRPDVEGQFRSLVQNELARVDLSDVEKPERFVLSASLVRIETRSSSEQAESVAVVSATLRRERGGALRAVIRGRAQAVDGAKETRAAEAQAMRAAVRSALGRLPEALR